MENFRLHMPTQLMVGPDSFEQLGRATIAYGNKALLVTGKSAARELGHLDRALELLKKEGVEVVVFEGIEPNPRHSTCNQAAAIVRQENLNIIVALGGGSVMDAAKAISAAAVSGYNCWDHCFHANGFMKVTGALPIITVPMTAATGSEANAAAVITNWETNEKCALIDPKLVPVVAICDPVLHTTVSAETTADGAVDILSHGIESYFNGHDDCSVQDRITEGLFNVVFEWAPEAYANGKNIRARRELQYASTLMLMGIANNGRSGAWPLHAMEHALSGHYDIPHGRGLAILIPRYLRYIIDTIPHRLAQFGQNCMAIEDADDMSMAEASLESLVDWLSDLGLDITLGDVGITNEKFEVMADDILRNNTEDGVFANIVPLDKKALIEIFELCLQPNIL